MTKRERITELELELDELLSIQDHCEHQWLPPVYCPETVKSRKIIGQKWSMEKSLIGNIYGEYTEIIDKWERECECCGKVQKTYKKESSIHIPCFD